MLYRYTPERRELDYLRFLGASKRKRQGDSNFRSRKIPSRAFAHALRAFLRENRHLAMRRATHGALLNLVHHGGLLPGVCSHLAACLSRTNDGGQPDRS